MRLPSSSAATAGTPQRLSRLRLWTRRFSRIFSVGATLLGETDFHNVTFLPESTLASILKDGFNGFTIHTLTARCVFETVTVAFGYWLFYWPALILLEFRVTFEHHFKKLFFIPNFGGSLLKSKERKSYKIVDGLWLEPPTANWIHHVTHEHWNESIWRRPCCATTAMDNMCHVEVLRWSKLHCWPAWFIQLEFSYWTYSSFVWIICVDVGQYA